VSVTTRRRNPTDPGVVLAGAGLVAAVVVFGTVWAAVRLGYWWTDTPTEGLPGPVPLLFAVIKGQVRWLPACTVAALAVLTAAALAATGITALVRRQRSVRGIDAAAPHLGHGRALAPVTAAGARTKARNLNVEGFIGLPIGTPSTRASRTSASPSPACARSRPPPR
jgi:uncharacterized SAM-binding protein YcdF (DUF218 family)